MSSLTNTPTNECIEAKLIGFYVLLIMLISILLNGLLVLIYVAYKEVRTAPNQLIVTMAVLNLISACLSFPFVILSSLNCRFFLIFDNKF
jgi:hypothetical protein